MEISLFKIATNSYHMAHPLSDDPKRYQKWDAKGIFKFALLTIFTLGIGSAVVLGTAYAKLKRLKKLEAEDTSAGKKADVSAQRVGIKAAPIHDKEEKKITEPKTKTQIEEVPEKKATQANPFDAEKNNQIIALIDKFENSAPSIFPSMTLKAEEIQDLYHGEIQKFESFLENELKQTSDDHLVYFCVGHGSVREQVWPGFIFEALQKDQKVKTILIEQGFKYPKYKQGYATMIDQYRQNYLDQSPDILKKFQNFSVNQFLCGLVSGKSKFASDGKASPDISKPVWRSKEQVNHVVELIPRYLEKLLADGKQVVIGDHRGSIGENQQLVKVYNDLIEKYPDQLHFLWGWSKLNALTDKKITEATIKEASSSEEGTSHGENWKKYENLTYIQFSELISDKLLTPVLKLSDVAKDQEVQEIISDSSLDDSEKAKKMDSVALYHETEKKLAEAERLLLKASELAKDDHYYNERLADFYLRLSDNPVAKFRAIDWCKKMFKAGDVTGAIKLGHLFEKQKNYKLAHDWFKMASERNNKFQRAKTELEAFEARLIKENISLE